MLAGNKNMDFNPLARCISAASQSVEDIRTLLGQAGVGNPDSNDIPAAYVAARTRIRQLLVASGYPYDSATEKKVHTILKELKQDVANSVKRTTNRAFDHGYSLVEEQMSYYGVTAKRDTQKKEDLYLEGAWDRIAAQIDSQIASVEALVSLDMPWQMIVPEDAVGILSSATVLSTLSFYAVYGAMSIFEEIAMSMMGTSGYQWEKQAIAALDERTTDCCLRVHGQHVPFTGVFTLTGEPAFAPTMSTPPFHNMCRTSMALYLAQYDYGITDQMMASAQMILDERAAGGSGYRHPASAFA